MAPEQDASADEEQGQARSSFTSFTSPPSCCRPASQRRPEQGEEGSEKRQSTKPPAFIPVADQAAAEYEAELKAKSEETATDASEASRASCCN